MAKQAKKKEREREREKEETNKHILLKLYLNLLRNYNN